MITREIDGSVAVLTLDRPAARNALTGAMIGALDDTLAEFDSDPEVRVVILTGRDPAFCAGLDLTDLARTFAELGTGRPDGGPGRRGLLPRSDTPIIGAVNGPAVTGGLELALCCDFLIASERATFADTHARVGVLPAGGMTIRLPQLIGIDRARQMSLTGNFVDAATACAWGLVTEVVPHAELMTRAGELAGAVSETDRETINQIRRMYDSFGSGADDNSYVEEARWSRRWMKEHFDASALEQRRNRIIERGSAQQ
jgi:enoyl-CoA hydratase